MATPGLFGLTINLLSKALDFRWERHGLLSSNITHKDTPGYQPLDLAFEGELKRAVGRGNSPGLRATHPRHIRGGERSLPGVRARVISSDSSQLSDTSGTVDIEKEMIKLAENQLLYMALVQALSKKLAGMKNAIMEVR